MRMIGAINSYLLLKSILWTTNGRDQRNKNGRKNARQSVTSTSIIQFFPSSDYSLEKSIEQSPILTMNIKLICFYATIIKARAYCLSLSKLN